MAVDFLTDLPSHLVAQMIEEMPARDILELPKVSQKWKDLFLDPENDRLWYSALRRKFPTTEKQSGWENMTWGEVFLALHQPTCHSCSRPDVPVFPGYFSVFQMVPGSAMQPYAFPLCKQCFQGNLMPEFPRGVTERAAVDLFGPKAEKLLSTGKVLAVGVANIDDPHQAEMKLFYFADLEREISQF